jgi:hypothetical protein
MTAEPVIRGRLSDAEKAEIDRLVLTFRKPTAGKIAVRLNRGRSTISEYMRRSGLRRQAEQSVDPAAEAVNLVLDKILHEVRRAASAPIWRIRLGSVGTAQQTAIWFGWLQPVEEDPRRLTVTPAGRRALHDTAVRERTQVTAGANLFSPIGENSVLDPAPAVSRRSTAN